MIDKIMLNKWGCLPVGNICKVKLILNRLFRYPFKFINKYIYKNWNWFRKPFNITDCYFITEDKFLFKGYDYNISVIYRRHEPFLYDFVEKNLKGGVFIDVGAHIGSYSIRAARLADYVIAIEPDPRNYYYLVSNIFINGIDNIIPIPLVAYHEPCFVKFKMSTLSGWSSITNLHADSVLNKISILAMPLDKIVKILNFEKNISMVKIDVEGAEADVLKGFTQTLRASRPIILIEIHGEENAKFIYEFLTQFKYKIKVLYKDEKTLWRHEYIAAIPE